MPSFYPRGMAHNMPLTPPEYGPNGNSPAPMNYAPGTFPPRNMPHPPGIIGQEKAALQAMDHNKQASATSMQVPAPGSGPVPGHYRNMSYHEQASRVAPLTGYYGPGEATVLPPVCAFRFPSNNLPLPTQIAEEPRQQPAQESKEEKSVGGVSSKLDYDMELMTEFVAETTRGLYSLFNKGIPLTDVDTIRRIYCSGTVTASFRKWVSQVLCATRLPSSTIFTSFYYLSMRMMKHLNSGQYIEGETAMQQLLIVALIMGSKFLDDNTFVNRSWAEVSGIAVERLNSIEKDWLGDIGWSLFCEPHEENGFYTWQAYWREYQEKAAEAKWEAKLAARLRAESQMKEMQHRSGLTPIDTGVQQGIQPNPLYNAFAAAPGQPPRPSHSYPSLPTPVSQPSAHTPSLSYDPWLAPPSDDSPPSAMHTGPTTPASTSSFNSNLFGGPIVWGPPPPRSYTNPNYVHAPNHIANQYPRINQGYLWWNGLSGLHKAEAEMKKIMPYADAQMMWEGPPRKLNSYEESWKNHFNNIPAWAGHGPDCACGVCPVSQHRALHPNSGYRMQSVVG